MKQIDSDALGIINRALGITGAGAAITQLMDGSVSQVLDVTAAVRRGRTIQPMQGVFTAILRNVHGAANTLVTTWSPYAGGTGTRPPWPDPVPTQFDVWLLQASTRQISGGGTFRGALFINYDGIQQGFGADDSGVAVVASFPHPIINWDGTATNTHTIGIEDGKLPALPAAIRLPRANAPGTQLVFSSTSSAIATFDVQLVVGLFPVTLGQDVFT